MRNNRLGYAALAATVSACLFSSAVGAWAADNTGLGGGSGFGTGGGLGAGSSTVGPAGGNGAAGTDGTQSGSASSNDRAVDRAAGVGQPPKGAEQGQGGPGATGKTAGPGKASGSDEGVADQKSGTTALGKPSDQKTEESDTAKSDKAAPDEDAAQSKAMMAAAAAPAETAPANAPEKPSIPDITGNGFFTQKIAIDVPVFHGLEPKLTLNYNSARKTRLGGLYQGWLGYAWGLDGFDVIERATPGYGYPAYDANDVFLLNGEELVPCTTGMVAASCLAGGTHVTENENFKRVVFDATANTWTVTDRDGTTSLFKSVYVHSAANAAAGTDSYKLQRDGRFLLSEVTDTYGNKVTYSYGDTASGSNRCTDAPVCYPRAITYGGGATISFYWEDRPDYQVMANGLSLSYTKKRLKTIGVKAGGVTRGAYALTYEQAPFSNTSRLIKVDRYGTDAVVDSAGVISAGTKKTLRSMTYDDVSFTYALKGTGPQPGGGSDVTYRASAADYNGDGKDELFSSTVSTACDSDGCVTSGAFGFVSFANDGTPTTGAFPLPIPNSTPTEIAFTPPGRFAAGSKDVGLVEFYSKGGRDGPTPSVGKSIIRINQDLTWAYVTCPTTNDSFCNALPSQVGGTFKNVVYDHDGNGFDIVSNPSSFLGISDMTGSGRQGVISLTEVGTYLNGAWKFVPLPVSCTQFSTCAFGDLNGDGTTDILTANGQVWLSSGNVFVSLTSGIGTLDMSKTTLRDADNDGKVDLYKGNSVFAVDFLPSTITLLSSGASVESGLIFGDFNGDGLPDYQSGQGYRMTQPGPGNPNLLRNVTLETGGTVSVDYTPSTRWTNKYMPQVLHAVTKLTVNDGRGTTAATSYAYAGGLYDPKARKFLGYETITVTKPQLENETAAPVTEITYRQDLAGYGLPAKTVSRDGANVNSKTVTETYTSRTSKPYRTFNTATDTLLKDSNETLTLRKERIFDDYGNINEIRDYARTDLPGVGSPPGDDTWTVYGYSPNTEAYIVSLPRSKTIRSGTFDTDTATVEQRQIYYYGNATNYTDKPTDTRLMKIGNYTSYGPTVPDVFYVESFTYDSAGNRLSHVDGAGNRTEWDYDSDKLYLVKERAPKYFITGTVEPDDTRFETTYTQNTVCGKPASKIDWNNVTETYTYDPFCRLNDTTNAGTGKLTRIRYLDEGLPSSQSVAVYEPRATGSGEVMTRSYYDGLGRLWRVRTPGDAGIDENFRYQDTGYDARGNAARFGLPRFSSQPTLRTIHEFDWQDRVVKTTNPDGTYRTYAYDLQPGTSTSTDNEPIWEIIRVDEEGKRYRTVWSCPLKTGQDQVSV